jgi:hypothetical protein
MYMSVYDGWHQVAHPHPRKILTWRIPKISLSTSNTLTVKCPM